MTEPDYRPPNLDLIRMVQSARMQHDADALPSRVSGVYWIEAKASDAPAPTSRSGQWVIATTLADVDDLWMKIKRATQENRLGYKSKVSTAAGPGQSDPNARLICVRTYDSADTADVQRIEKALRTLGIADELRYEVDST